MIVKDLLKIPTLELLTTNTDLNKPINGIYTCDLLSWAMGHIKEDNMVLLTVLNSINCIAVATLLDLSAIIFCEGVVPTIDIIKKAEEEGINIFKSTDTTFLSAMSINHESIL